VKALVYVEERAGRPLAASLGVLSRALELAGEAAAVVCGFAARAVAEASAALGPERVYLADDPALAAPLSQPRVDVLTRLVEDGRYDTVLFAASPLALDIAAGLADRLDAGLNWDLVDLELRGGELVGRRLALQDSVLVEVGWRGEPRLAVLRTAAPAPPAAPARAEVEPVPVQPREWSTRARVVSRTREESEGPSIETADIIVAGGRGLGGREGFALLEELAAELGGSVAASLPAVEIGWYPSSRLVGQSGKTVRPKLYLACGISGALQHRVGMEGSGTILAINTDPGAPIFDLCDLGVIGDVHEVVPRLIELLRAWKASSGH